MTFAVEQIHKTQCDVDYVCTQIKIAKTRMVYLTMNNTFLSLSYLHCIPTFYIFISFIRRVQKITFSE